MFIYFAPNITERFEGIPFARLLGLSTHTYISYFTWAMEKYILKSELGSHLSSR
jgi:hypothetical protein